MRKLGAVTLIFILYTVSFAITPASIPAGSTIYIEPNGGFETYLTAALQNKGVPVSVVTEKSKADFIMTSTMQHGKDPSAAQVIFLGKTKANEDASVTVVNAKTSVVAFAYSVHKYNAVHGAQSTAESVAKNLKNKIKSEK